MRSSATARHRNPASTRNATSASLSVVVVSSQSAEHARQATQSLSTASRGLNAQLILVAQNVDGAVSGLALQAGAELVQAPTGSTRAEMCDLGMSRASGTIVAVRDDFEVGDASWLDAYRSILPAVNADRQDIESVVMDSQVARPAALADVVAVPGAEYRHRVAAIEMAASL